MIKNKMYFGQHHNMETYKLWNMKTTVKIKLLFLIVQWIWNTAIVQCTQTH